MPNIIHYCNHFTIQSFIFSVSIAQNSGNSTHFEVWEYLFTLKTPDGWVGGSAGMTGILLLIILGIIFALSQPFVRERGYFEVR